MKIHNEAQGSLEWSIRRAGIATASEFDALISPTGEIRKGQMPATYLAMKVAEWWQGGPLPTFGSAAMEQGQIIEGEAIPWLSLEKGWNLTRTGLITTDDEKIGCSPDAMMEGAGVEIKAPEAHTQVKYLLKGQLPSEYIAQVQGGLLVTGLPKWIFLSYRRNFPSLLLEVFPDEEFQDSLREALGIFQEQFDSATRRLIEINGAPPRRTLSPMTKPMEKVSKPVPVNIDEIIP